jgi:hypothetical protein
MGSREYLPDLGRFASLDPANSNSQYVYANANPMSYTDPTGLSGQSWLTTNATAETGRLGSTGAAQSNCTSAVNCASMYATTAPLATKAQAIAIAQQPGDACYTSKGGCGAQVVSYAMDDAGGQNDLAVNAFHAYEAFELSGATVGFAGLSFTAGAALEGGAAVVAFGTGGIILLAGGFAVYELVSHW